MAYWALGPASSCGPSLDPFLGPPWAPVPWALGLSGPWALSFLPLRIKKERVREREREKEREKGRERERESERGRERKSERERELGNRKSEACACYQFYVSKHFWELLGASLGLPGGPRVPPNLLLAAPADS